MGDSDWQDPGGRRTVAGEGKKREKSILKGKTE